MNRPSGCYHSHQFLAVAKAGVHETTCTKRNEGKGVLTRRNTPSFGPSRAFGNAAESTFRAPGGASHHAPHVLAWEKAQVNVPILGRARAGPNRFDYSNFPPLAHRAPLSMATRDASRAPASSRAPSGACYRDAIEEQRRFACEFGLTPSARSGDPGDPDSSALPFGVSETRQDCLGGAASEGEGSSNAHAVPPVLHRGDGAPPTLRGPRGAAPLDHHSGG